MLTEIVGDFVSAKSIPQKATIRRTDRGDIVFSVIDVLYEHCYNMLTGSYIWTPNLNIARTTVDCAINKFKLFNLMEDIDALISKNKHLQFCGISFTSDIKKYINDIVNKYFKYVKPQIDCKLIVDGTIGELLILANSLDIHLPIQSSYTLRYTGKLQIIVPNERTMINVLKDKFEDAYTLLCTIMKTLYRLGVKQITPEQKYDLDL